MRVSGRRLRRVVGMGAIACAMAGAAPASSQADVEFGAADDYNLQNTYRPGTLESMKATGVQSVRLMAYEGRSNDVAFDSAVHAASIGLPVQLVLTNPSGTLPSAEFAAWAGHTARRFAPYAQRFSILNEPDLALPVGSLCDTRDEISTTTGAAGLRVTTVKEPYRTQKRRWTYRTRTVKGKRRRVRVQVVVTRRVKRWVTRTVTVKGVKRRVKRRVVVRVPVLETRYRDVRRVVSTAAPTVSRTTTVSPARGCLAIQRAHVAVATITRALPEVRQNAPGAAILLGETSAVDGVLLYIEEFLKAGLPADGWAHHPYPGPWDAALEHAERVSQLVAPLPVSWTEFGVHVRTSTGRDPETLQRAAEIWRSARAKAASLGVRQIVAYGWWKTDMDWDTAAEGVLHD